MLPSRLCVLCLFCFFVPFFNLRVPVPVPVPVRVRVRVRVLVLVKFAFPNILGTSMSSSPSSASSSSPTSHPLRTELTMKVLSKADCVGIFCDEDEYKAALESILEVQELRPHLEPCIEDEGLVHPFFFFLFLSSTFFSPPPPSASSVFAFDFVLILTSFCCLQVFDKHGKAFHVLEGPSGIGKSVTALISPCSRRLYFVYSKNADLEIATQSLYLPYLRLSSRLVKAAMADIAEHEGLFNSAYDFSDRMKDVKLRSAAVLKAILKGVISSEPDNWLDSLAFADVGPVDSKTEGCLQSELNPLVTLDRLLFALPFSKACAPPHTHTHEHRLIMLVARSLCMSTRLQEVMSHCSFGTSFAVSASPYACWAPIPSWPTLPGRQE